jgi:hypothetical protein
MKVLRFDIFGRHVVVEQSEDGWLAFYPGNEGKRRPATDIVIPPSLAEADIEHYLADLFHELASKQHPEVKRLE